ncbi:MAG: hypothetical protein PWP27_814 [Clostridiales bacterium]|jgi:hypothetical protein|nr:hypothetical protein [Clostridiales bacterium]MDK2933004.1 hypothetical protein [Clostridiales bacterium]
MKFLEYFKDLKKSLDEVEEYLDRKAEVFQSFNMNKVVSNAKKKVIKSADQKRPKHHKPDSQWITKTASKKLKLRIRKMSKHM